MPNEFIPVFDDYRLFVHCQTAEGLSGSLWHVHPSENGAGVQTPVGFLAGRLEEAADIRAAHWRIELFIRDEIAYDATDRSSWVASSQNFFDGVDRIRTGLEDELVRLLIERGLCTEPLVLTTNNYTSVALTQRGVVWLDDQDDEEED